MDDQIDLKISEYIPKACGTDDKKDDIQVPVQPFEDKNIGSALIKEEVAAQQHPTVTQPETPNVLIHDNDKIDQFKIKESMGPSDLSQPSSLVE